MRAVLLLLGLALLLRLPFLNQAIQGDDVNYLAGAQHAQIDPLHPLHAQYVFNGQLVEMRGHPHPPLNAWVLGGLLAYFGEVNEVRFHGAYIVFTFLALLGMYGLAVRFCEQPWHAVLLFAVVPAFFINGSSLESDIPFLAFWLCSIAVFVRAVDRRSVVLLLALIPLLAVTAFGAYQSIAFVPIMGFYLWHARRDWLAAWAVLLTPPVVLVSWQLWEKSSGGTLPVNVMAGYFTTLGLQTLRNKGSNALALTAHLAWIVFPVVLVKRSFRAVVAAAVVGVIFDWHPLFWVSFALGVGLVVDAATTVWNRDGDERFLAAWLVMFYGFALVIFFAGAARYLLPLAAPLVLLAVRSRPRFLNVGIVVGLLLSASLAMVNYQHWDGYRMLVASMKSKFEGQRVWINGEWGLRFYGEALGGLPVLKDQDVRAGDLVITSQLALPVRVNTGAGRLVPIAKHEISATVPLRTIALGSQSAFSAVMNGFRPFDIAATPIDVVTVSNVVERRPTKSFLEMKDPQADDHIVSGIYTLEQGAWRWTDQSATVMLKSPSEPAVLSAEFRLWGASAGRKITLSVDGEEVVSKQYEKADQYVLLTAPIKPKGEAATVSVSIDKAFQVAGDQRQLGFILVSLGFR